MDSVIQNLRSKTADNFKQQQTMNLHVVCDEALALVVGVCGIQMDVIEIVNAMVIEDYNNNSFIIIVVGVIVAIIVIACFVIEIMMMIVDLGVTNTAR
ncbi:putative integral membrane protein [Brugia pahangi]